MSPTKCCTAPANSEQEKEHLLLLSEASELPSMYLCKLVLQYPDGGTKITGIKTTLCEYKSNKRKQ